MFFEHLPLLIIVLAIALIVFGPKRLPELGSSLGRGIREFKKATSDLNDNLKMEANAPSLPPNTQGTPTTTTYAAPTAAPEPTPTQASAAQPAEYTVAGQPLDSDIHA